MDFLAQYNLTGLVIGVATFLIIGLFHPLVIKGEYHFGVRCWWVFLVMGRRPLRLPSPCTIFCGLPCWPCGARRRFGRSGSCSEQRRRVAKGWFPKRKGGANETADGLFPAALAGGLRFRSGACPELGAGTGASGDGPAALHGRRHASICRRSRRPGGKRVSTIRKLLRLCGPGSGRPI